MLYLALIPAQPVILTRLQPPGSPAEVSEIVAGFGLLEDPPTPATPRPYVLLNMVSTVDGSATLDGRSGPISGPADRELFHGLRSIVDAVMAGAGTVRTERYGPIVRDPDERRLRTRRGLDEQPRACIVTGRMALPSDLPLLADPDSTVTILTPSAASLPGPRAHVDYIRTASAGKLDLPAALAELHKRHGVRTLLCEGGPHLNAALLSANLVDELFLSLSPMLAGEPSHDKPLRIVAAVGLEPPMQLQLLSVLGHESHLFLRYRVLSPDRH